MNSKQVKKKIGKIDWYNQGGAVKLLAISYSWSACLLMKAFGKKIPVKYEILLFYKDHFMDDYISKRSLEKVARYYYGKQKRDKKFIEKLFRNWHKNFIKEFLALNKKILKEDFSKFTNKDLFNLFKKYSDVYINIWHESIFLDGFDFYGEVILSEVLKKENKEINQEDLDVLLSPPRVSFLQKERLETLEIAEKILKNKNTVKFISKEKKYNKAIGKYPWIKKKLKILSNKYYWLHNDYAVVDYLKPEYFYKNILILLSDKKKLKKEQEMKVEIRNLKKEKRKIVKKYKLSSGFVNTVDFLSFLGNFRDERKSYNQMAGNSLNKIASEFSKKTGINIETIEDLTYWEVKDIFNLDKKSAREVGLRKRGVFYILISSDKYITFRGKDGIDLNNYLKSFINKESKLQGRTTFAGIVEGKVKIIKSKKDFHKMKKGDILVAPNTRPEYVPVMKIAGAIVNEEGGITCHAAIVSRELKIPCVVGVQGVTHILKDGDLVEVDAERGVVKILKK